MAVPLFVLLLALFLGLFRVILVELQVDQALHYAAGTVAAFSQKEETDISAVEYGGAVVLFYGQLKQEDCESQNLKDGFQGIRITDTDSDSCFVRLHASYEICLPVSFFGKKYVPVEQYASARKWNGFQDGQGEADNIWVYITAFGTAYHRSASCPYLDLSVRSVSRSQVECLRNKDGGIYYPCGSCKADLAGSTVYITDYGSNYHGSLECRKLKRTLYRVRKSEAEGRSPCKKCYGS